VTTILLQAHLAVALHVVSSAPRYSTVSLPDFICNIFFHYITCVWFVKEHSFIKIAPCKEIRRGYVRQSWLLLQMDILTFYTSVWMPIAVCSSSIMGRTFVLCWARMVCNTLRDNIYAQQVNLCNYRFVINTTTHINVGFSLFVMVEFIYCIYVVIAGELHF
jgi:hypothetical protein